MRSGCARFVVMLVLGFGSALAQADVSGVYTVQEKGKNSATLKVFYRDAQHVRFEMRGEKPDEAGAMLLLKDKLYAITPQGEVMDMDALAGMMGAMNQMAGQQQETKASDFRLKASGQREQIAGIDGEVYQWQDGKDAGSLVLSRDARVQKLSAAMMRIAEHMQQGMGHGDAATRVLAARQLRELRDQGVLQSRQTAGEGAGVVMRLGVLDEKPLDDRLFTLPKGASVKALPAGMSNLNDPQMQNMMKEMLKQQGR